MINKFKDIKAYVFDLDDTLYDEEQYVSSAVSDVCRYVSKKYDKDYNELYEYCIHSIYEDGRGHTFDNLCEKYSLDEDVKRLVEIYRACNPNLVMYDDAKELIKYLKGNNKKIGIITDGNSDVQGNKAKALGLYEIAESVILTDNLHEGEQKLSKPNVIVYETCLKELNVSPNEAVYIGDNPLKDFVGAKKLGMKTVRIIREKGMFMKEDAPSEKYEADYTIFSLKELMIV